MGPERPMSLQPVLSSGPGSGLIAATARAFPVRFFLLSAGVTGAKKGSMGALDPPMPAATHAASRRVASSHTAQRGEAAMDMLVVEAYARPQGTARLANGEAGGTHCAT